MSAPDIMLTDCLKWLIAVENVKRAGGLNEFEAEMFDLARCHLVNKYGHRGVAWIILGELAKAMGVDENAEYVWIGDDPNVDR